MSISSTLKMLSDEGQIEAPARIGDEIMTGLLFVVGCAVISLTGLALMHYGSF